MKACTRRDIFLQIEPLHDYSSLAPLLCARRYGRDCQFNEGHELGRIAAEEILQARVDALVYRDAVRAKSCSAARRATRARSRCAPTSCSTATLKNT